jgi:hypothetical protein
MRLGSAAAFASSAVLSFACSNTGKDSGGATPDAASSAADPFAPMPDTSEGLTNLSSDVQALLEHGELEGACDRYWGGQRDRRSMLLCGKSMFFDEPFGTIGVPEPIVAFFASKFPNELGIGFTKLGHVEDPRSDRHWPLGLAPSAPMGDTPTLAFTCASCHMARLPDGRISIGTQNHDLDYGKEILTYTLVAGLGLGQSAESDHDPAAVAVVKPVVDKIKGDFLLRGSLVQTLASLGGSTSAPALSRQNEHDYASWKPGTLDFIIAPLPYDDEALTVTKTLGIWNQPMADEIAASGMEHAMLAWSGNAHTLLGFLKAFVVIGAGDVQAWPPEKIQPLVEYVYSLRAPANPNPPPAEHVATGKRVFDDVGCATCHDGPRGSGKRLYSYEEVGTDSQMKYWLDKELDGMACCNFQLDTSDTSLNHGVKSPRLVGMWTLKRFLHNGSVGSLDDLLCMNGPRGSVTMPAYGDGGHAFGCDLPAADKQALIAFLLSH